MKSSQSRPARRAGAVCAVCLCASMSTWAQSAVPVPKFTGPIAVTAESYPLAAVNRLQTKFDLAKAGYVEEEFLVSGTANVYNWAPDNTITVKTTGAPYTTRILVRRPSDPAKFSGNVIVENLENTRAYDWNFIWAYSAEYFMERGDAWVGLTHLPAAVAALKKFNPVRYASLSMANPSPAEACGARNETSDTEEGLRWDMMSQTAALLKSGTGPMTGFRVEYVIGSSHTGDVQTYAGAIHSHAKLANGKPAYDGYVAKTNVAPSRISRCSAPPGEDDRRRVVRNVDVPFFKVISQSDVPESIKERREDSDAPGDKYRLYEVAGSSHMDFYLYHNMPVVEDQVKAGAQPFLAQWPLAYQCVPETPTPAWPSYKYALNASFMNLDTWVRKGTPAPKAERMALNDDKTHSIVPDQFGNPKGGYRTPLVDVPTATYFANSAGGPICRNVGHLEPFDWGKLQKTYGSPAAYAAKLSTAVDKAVKDRWLTAGDGKRIKAEAVVPAGK